MFVAKQRQELQEPDVEQAPPAAPLAGLRGASREALCCLSASRASSHWPLCFNHSTYFWLILVAPEQDVLHVLRTFMAESRAEWGRLEQRVAAAATMLRQLKNRSAEEEDA